MRDNFTGEISNSPLMSTFLITMTFSLKRFKYHIAIIVTDAFWRERVLKISYMTQRKSHEIDWSVVFYMSKRSRPNCVTELDLKKFETTGSFLNIKFNFLAVHATHIWSTYVYKPILVH